MALGELGNPWKNKGLERSSRWEGSNVFVRMDKIDASKGPVIHIPSLFEGLPLGMKLAFAKGAF
jgi:hypothetical protein